MALSGRRTEEALDYLQNACRYAVELTDKQTETRAHIVLGQAWEQAGNLDRSHLHRGDGTSIELIDRLTQKSIGTFGEQPSNKSRKRTAKWIERNRRAKGLTDEDLLATLDE